MAHPLREAIYRDLFAESGEIKTPHDFLECGHVRPVAQDIIGNLYPKRRRCHKCTNDKEKDFNPSIPIKERKK